MTTSLKDHVPLIEQPPQEVRPGSDVSDNSLFISKSDTLTFSKITEDNIADENLNIRCTADKGTVTDHEDNVPVKCKYCLKRMSMLRKIEKIKSVQESLFFGPFGKNNSRQTDQSRRSHGCQTPASLYDRAELTYREMRRLAVILSLQNKKSMQTETFCKCAETGWDQDCRCGEENKYVEWVWDTVQRGEATSLKEQDSLVVFHEDYSSGTTAIRGLKAMDKDQHFWEIKLTTPVYGTDMMIGVGTKNVELNKYHNTFCSMLGTDADSWGISYDGRVQHEGKKSKYCSRFGQGTIIGVHLDMWHGTLTFYRNRQSLEFRSSFPSSLQFLCCQILRQVIPTHLSVLDALPMPPGLRIFLANNISWLLDVPHKRPLKPCSFHVCNICMPLKSALEGHTDDEISSDEERLGNISFRVSDDDSEEEDPRDFSDRALQRHSATRYLMQPSLRTVRGGGSLHISTRGGKNSFQQRSVLDTHRLSPGVLVPHWTPGSSSFTTGVD
ncbi:unnamed protein product [Candidula unifasciata]|uniref:SPRY domain-containing SOCS box protein 3 n=1 Tax=Candidula unifasciata TaxID=100452 RepID=A0A8S3YKX6_9EUPU|nr:unnamed protein product [Candidula unifasciata]